MAEAPAPPVQRQSLWSRPRRTRLYSSDRAAPRARRATDLGLAAGAVLAIVIVSQATSPPSGFEQALITLAASIPPFLEIVWRVLTAAPVAWGASLVAASLIRWRPDILRDIVLAAATGYGSATILGDRLGTAGQGVSLRLATIAAITAVASPHLARPFRSTGRWVIGTAAPAMVILGTATPSSAALGILCGMVSAAAIHLVLGSSGGRPPLGDVQEALRSLGIDAHNLSEARRQTAGVFLVDATDSHQNDLQVKVYGRDAWDAQVLAKAWRALWYRDTNALTLTRLQQAEHEAFVTLLAAHHGVRVDEVVNAGRSAGNDAIIVLSRTGRPIPDPSEDPDAESRSDLMGAMWDTVLQVQGAGIAHGDLSPRRFMMRGDGLVITGFEAATVSPTGDQQRSDLAQLLVSSALIGSIDEAAQLAAERIGTEELTQVLPYLQEAALGQDLRHAVANASLDLDALRAATAVAAGAEPPKLAKLRRVSWGMVARAGLMSLAAYFLISSLSGIDLSDVADDLRSATLGLLVAALILGQVPRFAQALATRGACPRPIAYGPIVILQFAISFVNLVLPSTAARIAVNIRFFQRQGIPPASAVSIGIIDSLGGFSVQLMVLSAAFLSGSGGLHLDLERDGQLGGGNLLTVLAVLVALVVLAAAVALAVPVIRRRVFERVKPWIQEVRETVGSLRSPAKLAQVIGGNMIAEVLFASTLGFVLAALGAPLPLATLVLINVSVGLFSGLMPVPGGIGVSEGALVVCLTAAGIDQATAFAATISYRIITYYLPPVWGALAFHRLERAGLL